MSVSRSLKSASYPAVVHDPDLALVRAELQRTRVVLERIDQHLLAREVSPPVKALARPRWWAELWR